jgi:integrase
VKIDVKSKGNGRLYTRTGSQFIWCGYFLRGKEYRESTKTADSQLAAKFLRKRLRETGADVIGAQSFVGPQQERIRVNELLDWLESDFRLRGKNSGSFLSQQKIVRDYFGCALAGKVTRETVDAFIEKQLKRGYKPATINRWTQQLGQAYKQAIDNGHLTTGPRIRRLSEKDNARTGFFSPEEFASVENHLPDHLKDFCRFAYTTSWRKAEVSSLQWEDVDGNQIRLRAANAKNGEGRSVIATAELAVLIERRRGLRQVKTESGATLAAHLFHLDGAPIASFRKSWWAACVAAGVGIFKCPKCEQAGIARLCPECKIETRYEGKLFHDLRRSAVRNMVRAGTPEHTAMRISGHKTPSMFKRYDIISEDDLRNAMDRVQSYIAEPQAARQPTPIRQATGGKN